MCVLDVLSPDTLKLIRTKAETDPVSVNELLAAPHELLESLGLTTLNKQQR